MPDAAVLPLQPSRGAQAALALAEALARRVAITERLTEALSRGDVAAVRTLVPAAQEASRSVNQAGEALPEIDFDSPSNAEMHMLLGKLVGRARACDEQMGAILASSGHERLADWLDAAPKSDDDAIAELLEDPWDRHLVERGASRDYHGWNSREEAAERMRRGMFGDGREVAAAVAQESGRHLLEGAPEVVDVRQGFLQPGGCDRRRQRVGPRLVDAESPWKR